MNVYHNTRSYIKELTLSVYDLKRSSSFYTNVMKLEIFFEDSQRISLGSNGKIIMNLIKSSKIHQTQEGLYHIAFLLQTEKELANWLQSNLNYPRFVGASHHGVSKAIYLEDPDRNGIEVYADTDDEKWIRRNKTIEMDSMPLDLDNLLSKANNSEDYHVTIGHLHLQTKDVKKAASFYQKLGFDLTLDMQSAMFMSFNGYHHHIAFNEWNKRYMTPHDKEVSDLQQFEIWYESKEIFNEVKKNLDQQSIQYLFDGDFITLNDPLSIEIKLLY